MANAIYIANFFIQCRYNLYQKQVADIETLHTRLFMTGIDSIKKNQKQKASIKMRRPFTYVSIEL